MPNNESSLFELGNTLLPNAPVVDYNIDTVVASGDKDNITIPATTLKTPLEQKKEIADASNTTKEQDLSELEIIMNRFSKGTDTAELLDQIEANTEREKMSMFDTGKINLYAGKVPFKETHDMLSSGKLIEKYPYYIPGVNMNDYFADKQKGSEKLKTGLLKNFPLRIGIEMAAGLVSPLGDIYNAVRGNIGDTNPLMNAFSDMESLVDNKFHVYMRSELQDKNLWQQMMSDPYSFFGKSLPEGASFTIAAMGTALLTRNLFGGTRIAGARMGARAARNLGGAGVVARDAMAPGKLSFTKNVLNPIVKNGKVGRSIDSGLTLWTSSAFEAHFEANMMMREAENDFFQNYYDANGHGPSAEEYNEFYRANNNAGNATFATNMAVLGASNALLLPKFMGLGNVVHAAEKASRSLKRGLFGMGIKRGEKGLWETIKATRPQKIAASTYTLGKGFFLEGLWEEGTQGVISNTAKTWLDSRFNPEAVGKNLDFWSAVSKGFDEQYGSNAGWNEVFIGGLMGMLFGRIGGYSNKSVRSRFQQNAEMLNKAEAAIMGNVGSQRTAGHSFTAAEVNAAKRTIGLNSALNAEESHPLTFSDSMNDAIEAKMAVEAEIGTLDNSVEEFRLAMDAMSSDDIKKYFGIDSASEQDIEDMKKTAVDAYSKAVDNFKKADDVAAVFSDGTKYAGVYRSYIRSQVFSGLQAMDSADRTADAVEKIIGLDGLANAVKHFNSLSQTEQDAVKELSDTRLKIQSLTKELEQIQKKSVSVSEEDKKALVTRSAQIQAEITDLTNKYSSVVNTQKIVGGRTVDIDAIKNAANMRRENKAIPMEQLVSEYDLIKVAEDFINRRKDGVQGTVLSDLMLAYRQSIVKQHGLNEMLKGMSDSRFMRQHQGVFARLFSQTYNSIVGKRYEYKRTEPVLPYKQGGFNVDKQRTYAIDDEIDKALNDGKISEDEAMTFKLYNHMMDKAVRENSLYGDEVVDDSEYSEFLGNKTVRDERRESIIKKIWLLGDRSLSQRESEMYGENKDDIDTAVAALGENPLKNVTSVREVLDGVAAEDKVSEKDLYDYIKRFKDVVEGTEEEKDRKIDSVVKAVESYIKGDDHIEDAKKKIDEALEKAGLDHDINIDIEDENGQKTAERVNVSGQILLYADKFRVKEQSKKAGIGTLLSIVDVTVNSGYLLVENERVPKAEGEQWWNALVNSTVVVVSSPYYMKDSLYPYKIDNLETDSFLRRMFGEKQDAKSPKSDLTKKKYADIKKDLLSGWVNRTIEDNGHDVNLVDVYKNGQLLFTIRRSRSTSGFYIDKFGIEALDNEFDIVIPINELQVDHPYSHNYMTVKKRSKNGVMSVMKGGGTFGAIGRKHSINTQAINEVREGSDLTPRVYLNDDFTMTLYRTYKDAKAKYDELTEAAKASRKGFDKKSYISDQQEVKTLRAEISALKDSLKEAKESLRKAVKEEKGTKGKSLPSFESARTYAEENRSSLEGYIGQAGFSAQKAVYNNLLSIEEIEKKIETQGQALKAQEDYYSGKYDELKKSDSFEDWATNIWEKASEYREARQAFVNAEQDLRNGLVIELRYKTKIANDTKEQSYLVGVVHANRGDISDAHNLRDAVFNTFIAAKEAQEAKERSTKKLFSKDEKPKDVEHGYAYKIYSDVKDGKEDPYIELKVKDSNKKYVSKIFKAARPFIGIPKMKLKTSGNNEVVDFHAMSDSEKKHIIGIGYVLVKSRAPQLDVKWFEGKEKNNPSDVHLDWVNTGVVDSKVPVAIVNKGGDLYAMPVALGLTTVESTNPARGEWESYLKSIGIDKSIGEVNEADFEGANRIKLLQIYRKMRELFVPGEYGGNFYSRLNDEVADIFIKSNDRKGLISLIMEGNRIFMNDFDYVMGEKSNVIQEDSRDALLDQMNIPFDLTNGLVIQSEKLAAYFGEGNAFARRAAEKADMEENSKEENVGDRTSLAFMNSFVRKDGGVLNQVEEIKIEQIGELVKGLVCQDGEKVGEGVTSFGDIVYVADSYDALMKYLDENNPEQAADLRARNISKDDMIKGFRSITGETVYLIADNIVNRSVAAGTMMHEMYHRFHEMENTNDQERDPYYKLEKMSFAELEKLNKVALALIEHLTGTSFYRDAYEKIASDELKKAFILEELGAHLMEAFATTSKNNSSTAITAWINLYQAFYQTDKMTEQDLDVAFDYIQDLHNFYESGIIFDYGSDKKRFSRLLDVSKQEENISIEEEKKVAPPTEKTSSQAQIIGPKEEAKPTTLGKYTVDQEVTILAANKVSTVKIVAVDPTNNYIYIDVRKEKPRGVALDTLSAWEAAYKEHQGEIDEEKFKVGDKVQITDKEGYITVYDILKKDSTSYTLRESEDSKAAPITMSQEEFNKLAIAYSPVIEEKAEVQTETVQEAEEVVEKPEEAPAANKGGFLFEKNGHNIILYEGNEFRNRAGDIFKIKEIKEKTIVIVNVKTGAERIVAQSNLKNIYYGPSTLLSVTTLKKSDGSALTEFRELSEIEEQNPYAVFGVMRVGEGQYAATTTSRISDDASYIGLPGARVDEGETGEEAVVRGMKEQGWNSTRALGVAASKSVNDKNVVWYAMEPGEKLSEYKDRVNVRPVAETPERLAESGNGNEFITSFEDIAKKDSELLNPVKYLEKQKEEDTFTEDLSGIIQEGGNINYDRVREEADGIYAGRREITRLNQEEERGRTRGGRIHVEASIVAGAIRKTAENIRRSDRQAAQAYEEGLMNIYALENNLMHGEAEYVASNNLITMKGGAESTVYATPDKTHVIKFMDISVMHPNGWMDFFDDLALHNFLFENTAYEVLGFSERVVHGENRMTVILKQPFIQGEPLSEKYKGKLAQGRKVVEKMMKEMGFDHVSENGTFYNNSMYVVDDLHLNNVFLGSNNELYVIDDVVSLNKEYDGIGGTRTSDDFAIQDVEEEAGSDDQYAAEGHVLFSVVTDKSEIRRLDSEEYETVYRAMVYDNDELFPVKATEMSNTKSTAKSNRQKGKGGKLLQWIKADEDLSIVDESGHVIIYDENGNKNIVAYNPYIHTSNTPLNDQFKSAQDMKKMVIVETRIPKSELNRGYRAEKALDTVGEKEWNTGDIQSSLSQRRVVILSRWAKPMRILPWDEVARLTAQHIGNVFELLPTNLFSPNLRPEMENLGYKFVKTNNQTIIQEGENVGKTWKQVYGTPSLYSISTVMQIDLTNITGETENAMVVNTVDVNNIFKNYNFSKENEMLNKPCEI